MERIMKISDGDRRTTRRHRLALPLRVRLWKSTAPEQRAESLNLSTHGVYFSTESPVHVGETVEILLEMPEAVTAEPPREWRCTGHVVRVDRVAPGGKLGVGVCFDCYEVCRAQASERMFAGQSTE
jgi:PilZ domain